MQHAPIPTTSVNSTNVAAAVISGAVTLTAIFVLGRASDTAPQHAAMVLGAMSISVLVLWFGLKDEPGLRMWSIGGIVATLGLGLVVGGVLARPTMVDEQVVMAGPVAMQADGDQMMAGGDKMAKERDAMMAKEPDAMMAKEPTAMTAKEPDAMMAKEPDAMMAKDDGAKPAAGQDKMTAGDDAKAKAPTENVLVSSGSFEPLEHAGRGTASIIRTTDGENVLTLTDFETDAGPDLVVMLVAGDPASDTDVEASEPLRLGKLKGTSGDQQYVLPADVDPADFTHAYIWCRAFSVGFTRARLA